MTGKKPDKGASASSGLPSKDEILDFLSTSQNKAGKREIARAFGIKGGAKIALKRTLSEMAREGKIAGNRKDFREKGKLSPVTSLEVVGRDDNGDLLAEPLIWNSADGPRPNVLIATRPRGPGSDEIVIGVGDHVLARVRPLADLTDGPSRYEGDVIKKLPRDTRRLVGIFRRSARGGGSIDPVSRKELKSWIIQGGDEGDAKDGDLVRFELRHKGRFATPQARVLETLGNPQDERKISLIAIHANGIPDDFPASVIAETNHLPPLNTTARTDLRHLPLLTIDPADARDHDDAVYAEADTDTKNKGGHVIIVAIADVAHYVRPNSLLDREAQLRGNSVYFPDRVVPMLPEKISNDLCSLRESEDRPCLAVRMIYDAEGNKRSHTFMRALMRSPAKLSYQEAQAAIDGKPEPKCAPLLDSALKPLWAAYAALKSARDRREPLDLDLPERKILLDKEGRIAGVIVPERLDAHRLIEEMMIQANVAAAETLESKRTPVVYRIHDQPSPEKLKGLKDFLETLGIKVPNAGELKPAAFNRILAKAKTMPVPELINEVVLRSQAQAEYNPQNIGHFGPNLPRYAHFTSPIRRYADLLVHRALIRALKAGDGGLDDSEIPRLPEICRAISEAERRAMAAERETVDRLIAAHLADRIGATFEGRISGVTRSGLFIRLRDTGADGFVPVSTLGTDFFNHVEAAHALVGSKTGETYSLGDNVSVRLVEAIPSAGALRFEMLSEGKSGPASPMKGFSGKRIPRHRRPGR